MNNCFLLLTLYQGCVINYCNRFVISMQRVLFHALTMRFVGQLHLQITRNLINTTDGRYNKLEKCMRAVYYKLQPLLIRPSFL
jgi:hypothetical protein